MRAFGVVRGVGRAAVSSLILVSGASPAAAGLIDWVKASSIAESAASAESEIFVCVAMIVLPLQTEF